MNNDTAAKVLLECEADVRQSILKTMKIRRVISILDKMSPNDAASMLAEYNADDASIMLKKMNSQNAVKIEELLSYKPGTVARYADDLFVAVQQSLTVEESITQLRALQRYPSSFYYVYITDENNTLVGVLSLKNLLLANPSSILKDIMKTKVVSVDMSHPIEYVKELITKYDLMSLPVIDINGRIKGVIDISKILDVVIDRTRSNEPFELNAEQKDTLDKNTRLRKYYSSIIKDMGKFMKDLDAIKPKKRDYVEYMDLKNLQIELDKKSSKPENK
jgi:Mg/Co/Ni transporter MgtE